MQYLFFLFCGIVSVKSSPFHHNALLGLLKSKDLDQPLEFDTNKETLTTLNSNKALEVAQNQASTISVVQSGNSQSTITLEFEYGNFCSGNNCYGNDNHNGPVSKKIGPVESGLRNLVAASSIASEELYLEMAALSADISKMVFTKSELLTSNVIKEIFKPFSIAEAEIRKKQECGRQFLDPLNEILGQIDNNLKTCAYNLKIVVNSYKNECTKILSSISMTADNMHNLADSCEIADNFAVGIFCVINNLSEANTRIVSDVKNMRQITNDAREEFSKAALLTMTCNKQLVESVTGKLNNLSKQVSDKCLQTEPQNLEIFQI